MRKVSIRFLLRPMSTFALFPFAASSSLKKKLRDFEKLKKKTREKSRSTGHREI